MKNAVFLDLYGTIIEKDYLGIFLSRLGLSILRPKFLPNAIKGLEMLSDKRIVIASNQGGINYGAVKDKDFRNLLIRLEKKASEKGVNIEAVYYCPHRISEKCSCRKPETGMLEKAAQELNIELKGSWFIGDQTCDVATGKKKGCKTILLGTGEAGNDGKYNVKPDYKAKDLYHASIIINQEK